MASALATIIASDGEVNGKSHRHDVEVRRV